MKTKIRKYGLIICLVVCVVLCSGLGSAFMKAPAEASADGIAVYSDVTVEADTFKEGVTYETADGILFEYKKTYNGYFVTGALDGVTEVVIPDAITLFSGGEEHTYSVMRIGTSAFEKNTDITSVSTGDGLKVIESYAFSECTSLTSVTFGSSVTTINTGAFYNCKALESIYFNAASMNNLSENNEVFYYAGRSGSGITVTVGAGVTKIPAYLFNPDGNIVNFVPNITTVTFEDGSLCETIGSYAFYDCRYLTTVTIPECVETIGEYAFNACVLLGTVYFNAVAMSDVEWQDRVFEMAGYSGSGITVTVGAGVTRIPAYLFAQYTGTSYYNPKVTRLEFASGSVCKEIGKYVFYKCTDLKSVTLPSSLTSIGAYAFYECESLTTVTIPDSVTAIEKYTFYECTALTSVVIGNSVTKIGESSFYGCSKLTSVTIPKSVTTITSNAFYKCSKLTAAVFIDTEGWYCSKCTFSSSSLANSSTAATYLTSTYYSYSWYKEVTEEFEYALSSDRTYYILTKFNNDKGEYTDVVIENEYNSVPVKEIASSVFEGHTEITSIIIPENIVTIGNYAFCDCTKLSSVTIRGSGLEKVEADAFSGCSVFKSLYVSSTSAFVSVDYDGRYANPLAVVSENKGSLYVGGDSYTSLSINGADRIGTYALAYCTIISGITIGESVETIGAYAFYGNTAIKTITIPSSVIEIDEYAFDSMSLETLTLESWSGWTATSGSSSKTFQASELQQGNALTFLTSTYASYVWTRTATTTAAPTIECSIENGGYTNGSIFIATGVDANCTILYICYTDPKDETHSVESSTLTLSEGLIEGMYVFWAVDSEMVESERYHITYDNTPPQIALTGAAWEGYSGEDLTVIATDNTSPVTLYCSTDGGETWTNCDGYDLTVTYSINPKTDHSSDGVYYFKAEDAAGNLVGPYWITMDTVEPEGSWGFTDDFSLYFSWEAPSYAVWTCTINGKSYTKGTTYREETTYTVVLVSNNGEKFEDSYTLDHEWGEPEYVEPTCQEDGYWKYTCIYCGRIEKEVDEYSTSGEHNYELVEVPASCTVNGYSQYVCSDCGATTGYTVIYAQGHKWSNSDVSVPATCTTNGFLGQVCDVCGAQNEYGTVIPATGHDWVNDENFYIEATCETRGQSRETCTICEEVRNTVYTAALGHILVTESHSATCTEYGYSKTYCTREGCDYTSTDDGEKILAAHSWNSEPLKMVSASCEEEGYIIYVCEACGKEETVALNPSGHTWVYSGETTIKGNDGEETAGFLYTCSKCGDMKVEAYTDAKAAGNAVTEIFQKYQNYLWWILLALVVVWSLFIGLRWALQRNDQEKVKTRSMLANYVLGLFVIAVIIVGLPYLVYAIAILVG